MRLGPLLLQATGAKSDHTPLVNATNGPVSMMIAVVTIAHKLPDVRGWSTGQSGRTHLILEGDDLNLLNRSEVPWVGSD